MKKALDKESISQNILSIQNHFGFKTKKICEIMNIKEGCFRNNLSDSCPSNFFKEVDLENLKNGVEKLYKNFKLNIK